MRAGWQDRKINRQPFICKNLLLSIHTSLKSCPRILQICSEGSFSSRPLTQQYLKTVCHYSISQGILPGSWAGRPEGREVTALPSSPPTLPRMGVGEDWYSNRSNNVINCLYNRDSSSHLLKKQWNKSCPQSFSVSKQTSCKFIPVVLWSVHKLLIRFLLIIQCFRNNFLVFTQMPSSLTENLQGQKRYRPVPDQEELKIPMTHR